MRQFGQGLLWPVFLVSHLLVAALLAWHLLAQLNFGYALAYPMLDIREHIQTFGPQNRYKKGFGETSPQEHKALFAAISTSIQNSGKGLREIKYSKPDGSKSRLLREPEVVHLQDVALLVDAFYRAGAFAAFLFVILGAIAYRYRLRPPRPGRALAGFALVLAVAGVILALLGPVKVFYGLHDLIFPPDNPWFFYYQDSLMTTLMKAPDLFGFIGALLLLLSLVIWGLSGWGLLRLYRARQAA